MNKKEDVKKCIKKTRLMKTLTWRAISWVMSSLIAYVITGNIAMALSLGIADTLIKGFIYWGHEYKWDKVIKQKIKKIYADE